MAALGTAARPTRATLVKSRTAGLLHFFVQLGLSSAAFFFGNVGSVGTHWPIHHRLVYGTQTAFAAFRTLQFLLSCHQWPAAHVSDNALSLSLMIPLNNVMYWICCPSFDVTQHTWSHFLLFQVLCGTFLYDLPAMHSLLQCAVLMPVVLFLDFQKTCSLHQAQGACNSHNLALCSQQQQQQQECGLGLATRYMLLQGLPLLLLGAAALIIPAIVTPRAGYESASQTADHSDDAATPAQSPAGTSQALIAAVAVEAEPAVPLESLSKHVIFVLSTLRLRTALLRYHRWVTRLAGTVKHSAAIGLICFPVCVYYILYLSFSRLGFKGAAISRMTSEELLVLMLACFGLGRDSAKLDMSGMVQSIQSRLQASHALLVDVLPAHVVNLVLKEMTLRRPSEPGGLQQPQQHRPQQPQQPQQLPQGRCQLRSCSLSQRPASDADPVPHSTTQPQLSSWLTRVWGSPCKTPSVSRSSSEAAECDGVQRIISGTPSVITSLQPAACARVFQGSHALITRVASAGRSQLQLPERLFSRQCPLDRRNDSGSDLSGSFAAQPGTPRSGSPCCSSSLTVCSSSDLCFTSASDLFASPCKAALHTCPLERISTSVLESVASSHPCITIFFSDICGFSTWSSKLPPEQVMSTLNDLYTRLDNVILTEFTSLYKIETIGDAYVMAANLLTPDADHAATAVRFALRAQQEAAKVPRPDTNDGSTLQMRIGLHSGSIMSGIVGKLRRRFCLFGDTVNVASRTETTCPPGCIQLTSSTYALAQPSLGSSVLLTERGEVWVKGREEPLVMHLASLAPPFNSA